MSYIYYTKSFDYEPYIDVFNVLVQYTLTGIVSFNM